jgi:DNA-binding response OmpR family regulator
MQRMGAILVLDNDCTIVELISAILSDEGYVVGTTLASNSPFAAILAEPPALILLDSALPTLTKAAVLEYARGASGIPVIIMTTNQSNAAEQRALDRKECLVKPFLLDDLLAYVARYVRLPCTEAEQLSIAKPSFFQDRRSSLLSLLAL